MSININL